MPEDKKLIVGDRADLRRLVDLYGVSKTAELLGVSRTTIASAVAGIAVRRGSVLLLRDALAARRGKGAAK